MLNKISLRLRLTLLTGAILTIICFILTTFAIVNANNIFVKPIESNLNSIRVESQMSESAFSVPRVNEEMIKSEMSATLVESQNNFRYNSTLYLIAIIIGGTMLTWFILGRALMPVTNLSIIINDIDENSLSEVIPVPESDDEISKLTESFNSMLRKLNKAFEGQKRFAQNAAHELKTPLAAILTNIEVTELDEEPTLEECRETIKVTKDNVEKMIGIVSDLLMINDDLDKEMKQRFNGYDLVNKIALDYTDELRRRNIDLTIKGNGEYIGNIKLIERGVANIIQNAIRYNVENGAIDVILNKNEMKFIDSGVGIPKDSLDKIFEPFYCVDASRSKKLGGSGLGLSIVKSIIDKHKWNIKIESEIGRGTIITINM